MGRAGLRSCCCWECVRIYVCIGKGCRISALWSHLAIDMYKKGVRRRPVLRVSSMIDALKGTSLYQPNPSPARLPAHPTIETVTQDAGHMVNKDFAGHFDRQRHHYQSRTPPPEKSYSVPRLILLPPLPLQGGAFPDSSGPP